MKLSFLALALVIPVFAVHGAALTQETNAAVDASGTAEMHTEFRASDPLRQFNSSLVALTKKLSPAVVQIMVTAYGPADSGTRNDDVALFVRQQAIGSGVILDPNGYIITNAHVVKGAQRIRVAMADTPGSSPLDMPPVGKHRILAAKLIGLTKTPIWHYSKWTHTIFQFWLWAQLVRCIPAKWFWP